MNFFKISL